MEKTYLAFILEIFAKRITEATVDLRTDTIKIEYPHSAKLALKPDFEETDVFNPEPKWVFTVDMSNVQASDDWEREELCQLLNLVDEVSVNDEGTELSITDDFVNIQNFVQSAVLIERPSFS